MIKWRQPGSLKRWKELETYFELFVERKRKQKKKKKKKKKTKTTTTKEEKERNRTLVANQKTGEEWLVTSEACIHWPSWVCFRLSFAFFFIFLFFLFFWDRCVPWRCSGSRLWSSQEKGSEKWKSNEKGKKIFGSNFFFPPPLPYFFPCTVALRLSIIARFRFRRRKL